MKNYREYIENHTLRCEASHRGGGIEIDLTDLFPYIEGAKMTAYQNYLGGGMLGAVCNSYNFNTREVKEKDQSKLARITDQLKRFFHTLTNHEGDKWEEATYEQNQNRPESAY